MPNIHHRRAGLIAAAVLLVLVLAPAVSKAQTGKAASVKLAVMTIENSTGDDLSGQLIDNLTDFLRTQIARRGNFIVIDKSRQAAALQRLVAEERKESYKKCYDESCQIPLGKALSADTVLRVKITRIGSTYHLSAEMVDLAKEAVDPGKAASVEVPVEPSAGREDRLLGGIRSIARQIAGNLPGGGGETVTLGTVGEYGLAAEGGEGGANVGDGIVRFESDPPGAKVTVDGRVLPKVTPVDEFLQLGKRKVKVTGPEGYADFSDTVELRTGQTVKVTLRPLTSSVLIRPRDSEGKLLTDVGVFLDGEEVARAPVRIQGVRIGARKFSFAKPGLRTVDKVVKVRKGRTAEVDVRLHPSAGTLQVKKGAVLGDGAQLKGVAMTVSVDGQPHGKTPLKLTLKPGPREVTVGHDLARTRTYTVDVVDGKTATLAPELTGASGRKWERFRYDKEVSRRTGRWGWSSIISSAPGRITDLPFDEGVSLGRYMQIITFGVDWEWPLVSLRLRDSLFELTHLNLEEWDFDLVGVGVFTNPEVMLVLRPTPLSPLRLDLGGELNFSWNSDETSTDEMTALWTAGTAHLALELWQEHVMGHPRLEVAGGVRKTYAYVTAVPDEGEEVSYSGSGTEYGGRAQLILAAGDVSGLFLGGAYYKGDHGASMEWTVDWRIFGKVKNN